MMIHVHSKGGQVSKRVSRIQSAHADKVFSKGAGEMAMNYVLYGLPYKPGPNEMSERVALRRSKFPREVKFVAHTPIHPDFDPSSLSEMTSTTDLMSIRECKERVLDAARDYARAKWWYSDRGDRLRNLKYWANRLVELEEQYANDRPYQA